MGKSLFGTDGVRGPVGEVITGDLARALGAAAARSSTAERPRVLVVMDTRESGPMLARELAVGVAAAGGDAQLAGVLPTPAASVLSSSNDFDLAAVVSASHNPWRDNGIKFFAGNGGKISDALQERIENELAANPVIEPDPDFVPHEFADGLEQYLENLERRFPLRLGGITVAIDAANGATFEAAPRIFSRIGAEVVELACDPDGRNINQGCGSTHPEMLVEAMREGAADIGFAFDGDGDRVIAVDRNGEIRDGDDLIALLAIDLAGRGELGGGVAVTQMSNYGFHQAMAKAGVEVDITPVGDRHVAASLEARGWNLGGEQSGHIIWRPFVPTGDGIAAALLLMQSLDGADLADQRPMEHLPQLLVNVRVDDPAAVASHPDVVAAADKETAALEGRGRVLLRPSGTEPLVRVMAEAPTGEEAEAVCSRIVAAVEACVTRK